MHIDSYACVYIRLDPFPSNMDITDPSQKTQNFINTSKIKTPLLLQITIFIFPFFFAFWLQIDLQSITYLRTACYMH